MINKIFLISHYCYYFDVNPLRFRENITNKEAAIKVMKIVESCGDIKFNEYLLEQLKKDYPDDDDTVVWITKVNLNHQLNKTLKVSDKVEKKRFKP